MENSSYELMSLLIWFCPSVEPRLPGVRTTSRGLGNHKEEFDCQGVWLGRGFRGRCSPSIHQLLGVLSTARKRGPSWSSTLRVFRDAIFRHGTRCERDSNNSQPTDLNLLTCSQRSRDTLAKSDTAVWQISCHSKNQKKNDDEDQLPLEKPKKKNDDEDDKVLVSAMNSFSLLHHPLRNLWGRIKEIYNYNRYTYFFWTEDKSNYV